MEKEMHNIAGDMGTRLLVNDESTEIRAGPGGMSAPNLRSVGGSGTGVTIQAYPATEMAQAGADAAQQPNGFVPLSGLNKINTVQTPWVEGELQQLVSDTRNS